MSWGICALNAPHVLDVFPHALSRRPLGTRPLECSSKEIWITDNAYFLLLVRDCTIYVEQLYDFFVHYLCSFIICILTTCHFLNL